MIRDNNCKIYHSPLKILKPDNPYSFFFVIFFLLFPSFVFSQGIDAKAKAATVDVYLDAVEAGRKNSNQEGAAENSPDKAGPVVRQEEFIQAVGGDNRKLRQAALAFLGEDGFISFGLQLARISGQVKYHIMFDNDYSVGGHGESALEWPIHNILSGVLCALGVNSPDYENKPKYKLDMGFWFKCFSRASGKMKDSDWIQNDKGYIDYNDDGVLNNSANWATNHDGKDIYSESDTNVEALTLLDLDYLYNFLIRPKYTLGVLAGFRYEMFKFSSTSLAQAGYGPYGPGPFDAGYTDTQNLKWCEYAVKTQLPYIGIASSISPWERFTLYFKLGFSQWVRIKDKDVHLYPDTDAVLGANVDMISRGVCKGKAYLADIVGSCRIDPFWTWNLGFNCININTKGKLKERFYYQGYLLGASDDIDHTVKTSYWMLNSSLVYSF
jgi:outer membrane protease